MILGLDACHYRGSTSSGSNSPTEEMVPATAVLHRDLKPENVFLDGNQNIKIGDFGLSKEMTAQSFACTYVGTPYYMSPELATGAPYDIKADIWALGCVAFELCALAPPFDAQDQAELTRKIKLGHIPELPRGYSNDLGNLIRSMLDLNPKRRPTTKHLLKEAPIRLACRTMELSVMSKRISAEKNKLRAQYYELEMRERAIAAREEEYTVRQASASRERDLDEREGVIREREAALQAREVEVGERERQFAEMQSRSEASKGRHAEEGYSRERSSSSHHTASSIARRPIPRRVSSGTVARVRASPSAEVALDIVHVRPVLITPRSSKAEAVRQRFGRVSGLPALGPGRSNEKHSRHRVDSTGSEEWIDNETEAEADTQVIKSDNQDATERAAARSRRQSCSTTSAAVQSSEEALEKYSQRSRSTRKSISVMSPAGRHYTHEEDISMRDASVFYPSDDKENLQRYDASAWEKGQSLPTTGARAEEIKAVRPALSSRATVAAAEAINPSLEGLAPPPIYDISNDEDLPSPFLRKVTRQNNEIIAKRITKSGSGLVGPNNFLARAAAAGAARQFMAAAKEQEVPEATARKSVNRRLSNISTASSNRKPTMTTSNSAIDVRSNEAMQAPAPIIKRRSSAVPSSTAGLASLKVSSRKSCLIPPVPVIRQRSA